VILHKSKARVTQGRKIASQKNCWWKRGDFGIWKALFCGALWCWSAAHCRIPTEWLLCSTETSSSICMEKYGCLRWRIRCHAAQALLLNLL